MGFLASDITPISSLGPTPLIPTAKDIQTKVFQIARTESTSTLKMMLPADASVVEVSKYGSTNSDAGTSSTLNVVIANNTGTISSGTADMKTTGTTTSHVQMSNLPNIQPLPLAGDLKVSAYVTEVGTASTAGGPWYIKVLYVR
ncbi:hypothetical protein UFOVP128_12 [uncultured Caudovirales phage]|uniref:Uncharacterized protein n=1 Tax=uncultured Caudovirales phage TaxID=2100421 RepID=A0A6J5L7J3_9CAUD|nr:hypothetical protein UFOVP128_12 [uncultured Caudovirales phage]CAB5222063.1 hypothetical protein UFOVP243_32 [uncultured Caudovirales phage]